MTDLHDEVLAVTRDLGLADDDPRRTNSRASPEAVRPRPDPTVRSEGGCLQMRLPPVSWTAVALATTPA